MVVLLFYVSIFYSESLFFYTITIGLNISAVVFITAKSRFSFVLRKFKNNKFNFSKLYWTSINKN